MKVEELAGKVGDYLVQNAAPKMSSPVTKFIFGAAASVPGKRILAAKLAPFASMVAKEDGEIDLVSLRDIVMSGISASGAMPLLGGLVTVDRTDAESLFSYLGVPA